MNRINPIIMFFIGFVLLFLGNTLSDQKGSLDAIGVGIALSGDLMIFYSIYLIIKWTLQKIKDMKTDQENESIIYCSKCGTKNDKNSRFCSKCEQAIENNNSIALGQLIKNTEKKQFSNTNDNSHKKTISYLNSKAWYRFLKVIYVFLLILVLLGYNLIFKTDLRNVDQNKTLIQCGAGTYKTFTPKSIRLDLDKNDFENEQFNYENFFRGYNDYKIRNILVQCAKNHLSGWKSDDVFVIQRAYEIVGVEGAKKTYDKNYLDSEIKKITTGYKTNQEKASYLDFSIKFFDIKPVFTYDAFIQYFVIGNLIILFIFEVIKRIFYYIALGSLFPKK